MNKCKSCGHDGSKENPLAIQGNREIPYCHECLKKATMAAAQAFKKTDWYKRLNK